MHKSSQEEHSILSKVTLQKNEGTMSIEYYKAQKERQRKAAQNRNTLLYNEWRDDFDKRQALRQAKLSEKTREAS